MTAETIIDIVAGSLIGSSIGCAVLVAIRMLARKLWSRDDH